MGVNIGDMKEGRAHGRAKQVDGAGDSRPSEKLL